MFSFSDQRYKVIAQDCFVLCFIVRSTLELLGMVSNVSFSNMFLNCGSFDGVLGMVMVVVVNGTV